jgi:hypothetical protein
VSTHSLIACTAVFLNWELICRFTLFTVLSECISGRCKFKLVSGWNSVSHIITTGLIGSYESDKCTSVLWVKERSFNVQFEGMMVERGDNFG